MHCKVRTVSKIVDHARLKLNVAYMGIILLIINGFLFFRWFRMYSEWRVALVQTMLLMAGLTAFFTEILSAFNLITFWGIATCWILTAMVLGLVYKSPAKPNPVAESLSYNRRGIWILLTVFCPLIFLTFFVPPNNYDSMSYHLPRIMHWIQYQNVSYYPTNIARQLYHNPLAEYLILHLQMLSGSDWFANAIQFGAMVGSLVLISLIVERFGVDTNGQWLAVMLAFSIPMGLFQSTSTQNDYVAAFFLLAVIYLLPLLQQQKEGLAMTQNRFLNQFRTNLFCLALALSLGAFTKYTMLIFAFPFCLWFGIKYLQNLGVVRSLQVLLVIVFFIGITLIPFIIRNYRTFSNPVGPTSGTSLNLPMANTPINAANTLSNIIRNVANHLGLPIPSYNRMIDKGAENLHNTFNISFVNRNNTYLNDHFFTTFGYDEDSAANLLIVLLFVYATGTIFLKKILRRQVGVYATSVIIGFVLFSALLRWQSTSVRLLLPLTLASVVPIAVVLHQHWSIVWQRRMLWVLWLTCLPYVWLNKSKPIVVVENWVRHWLNQPHQQITETKFAELLITTPQQADFLQKNYRKPYLTHFFQLQKEVSETDKKRLIVLFDSLNFMQRKSVLFTSRHENYFWNRKNLFEPFDKITDLMAQAGCRNIGLDLGFDGMEYPLWVLIKDKIGAETTLRYVHYAPVLAHTPNAPQNFKYDCLVTEFDEDVKLFDRKDVKSYHDLGEIKLIIFQQPQKKLFVKDRFFFDPSYL